MKNEYSVAQKIAGLSQHQYPVEIGAVVSLSPFTLRIGTADYESTFWTIWTAYRDDKALQMSNTAITGTDSEGGAVHIQPNVTAEKVISDIDFKVGDRVAVQQLADEKTFLILSKVRRL